MSYVFGKRLEYLSQLALLGSSQNVVSLIMAIANVFCRNRSFEKKVIKQ